MVKPRQDFLGAITRLAEDGSGVVDGYGAELRNVTIVLNERNGIPATGTGKGSFWVHYDGYEGRPKFTDRDGYTIDLGIGRDGYITSTVYWYQITGTPTTIIGYNITDAVNITDYRLTNARTPTIHANTHLLDGYDPIDGYYISLNYSPLNYTFPTNQIIGEHLRRIDDKLGILSGNTVLAGRTINTTTPLQGGGTLATDLTLSVLTVSGSSSGVAPRVDGYAYKVLGTADGYNVDWLAISNNFITSVAWSKITGTPTTINGYGITDAASKIYVDGYFNTRRIDTTAPLGGGGALSSNLTLTVSQATNLTSGVVPSISVPSGLLGSNNGTSVIWLSKITTSFITAGTTPNTVISSDGYNASWTQVSNAMISSVAWNKITETPTTIAGYNITDAVQLATIAPVNITKSTASIGLSIKGAREDHKHDISTDVPSALTVGGSSSEGTSISLARADHLHSLPAFGTTIGTFAQGNDSRFPPPATISSTALLSNGSSSFWGKISDGYILDVNWSKITNKPTTITGYNITDAASKTYVDGYFNISKTYVDGYFNTRRVDTTAPLQGGGSLASNLTLSISSVSNTGPGVAPIITGTNRVLLTNGSVSAWGQISDGYILNVSWGKITGTPTTIAGYNITDATSKTYVDGYFNTRRVDTTLPLVGGGSLSSNLTISINSVSNTNPGTAPTITGINRVLLTNGSVGIWGQVSDGYISDVNWNKITNKPTTITGYNITDAASKTYVDGYFNTRRVDTAAPLNGGGSLSSNLMLSISTVGSANSGILPASGTTNGVVPQYSSGSGNVIWSLIHNNNIEDVSWTKITGKPTTINGYGITDAASKIYVDGYFNTRRIDTTAPLSGGGSLASNLTLSIATVNNVSSGIVPVVTTANRVLLTNATNAGWGLISDGYVSDVSWTKISNKPTTINGYGITDAVPITRRVDTIGPLLGGGALSSNLTLSLGPIADGYIVSLSWSKITNTPTTINGYGITDAVPTARRVDTTAPLAGGGALSANLTLSIAQATNLTPGIIPAVAVNPYPRGLLGTTNGTSVTWLANIGSPFLLGPSDANQVLVSTGINNTVQYTALTEAMLPNINWSKITSKPTTLIGYGITDAVPSARTITATSPIRIGGGDSADLSANRTLSILAASGSTAGSMSSTHFTRVNGIPDTTTSLHGYLLTPSAVTANTYVLSSPLSLGLVSGSGTAGRLPKFTGLTTLGNSLLSESGSIVTVDGVVQGKNHSIPLVGAPEWCRIGRFTAAQSGQTIRVTAYVHAGYNASDLQDSVLHIIFKTSNGGQVNGYGFAGNSTFYATGASAAMPTGYVKWKANAAGVNATYYDLYMYLPAYTHGSHYVVDVNNDSSWSHLPLTGQSDPGVASSTILIPNKIFQIVQGEIILSNTTFSNNVHVMNNISLQPHLLDTTQNDSTIQYCSNGGLVVNEGSNSGSYNISPEPYYHSSARAARWYKASGGFSLTGSSNAESLTFLTQIHGQNVPNSRTVSGTFFISWLGNGSLTKGGAQMFLFVVGVGSLGTITSLNLTNVSPNGHLDSLVGGDSPLEITSAYSNSYWNIIIKASSASVGEVTRCVWKIEYGWANS